MAIPSRPSKAELDGSRYALLRSFRRDGTAVDTPIWFAFDGDGLVFRTKVGPKTRRLAARGDVELVACDYRGRVRPGDRAPWVPGRATVLSGADAERANRVLHRRYGWQWNIVPLIKVPGVTNVHRDLCLREKVRRARDRGVWPDSVIVRVSLA
ncbi:MULTISPECIES: PPOX class F420-dependent oxidoreductase [Mycobacterium avium complex (MAC)]|nr:MULTISPECIES: PPOX class F420-dependent oxidoreductase [Mycobacterium avium complex (MAC)]MCA2321616.1 PPOX class F420-dependent oxidoreductase [Mycobacterium intracellulare]MCA2339314.1 PPOX class F420-dependent oxidoreductase [Mycobacterium intracellulare]MDV6976439.1 PPOX class F420-dependent oxidoreductase [Mycobacterium intracellulare]MDV6984568.1 PPOX class F420-dependent oxidoreductase [Mycobacterium intracellulare]MDV7012085.1 PPOX class F420-dependent oxidoreductase [Mycobacterium 